MTPERLEQVCRGLKKSRCADDPVIGFGVASVHERLQLLFGTEYGLHVSSESGQGTRVAVRIPKRLQAERSSVAESGEEVAQIDRVFVGPMENQLV